MNSLNAPPRQPIQEIRFLEEVEARLRRALKADVPLVADDARLLLEAARHLCLGGGAKRVRPRLVHAFGEAVGAPSEELVPAAVAAELIHAASLMHDDVVDEGTVRRGRPTANRVWGNTVAVLSGDLLLSIAFAHLKRLDPAVLADSLDVVHEMTRAAITEVCQRGRADSELAGWRRVAEGKTGALFALCGRSAAHVSGRRDAVDPLDRCGRHLGVAFQLADDMKDLMPAIQIGKDRLADIRSRSPSYPLIVASASSEKVRSRLKEVWSRPSFSEREVEELEGLVLATPALDETRAAFLQELREARGALGEFVETPGGARVMAWAESLAGAIGTTIGEIEGFRLRAIG